MFLHIGGARIVFTDELIGIFDFKIYAAEENNDFFQGAHKLKGAENGEEKPKSFILTDHFLHTSPIAPLTLAGRHERVV